MNPLEAFEEWEAEHRAGTAPTAVVNFGGGWDSVIFPSLWPERQTTNENYHAGRKAAEQALATWKIMNHDAFATHLASLEPMTEGVTADDLAEFWPIPHPKIPTAKELWYQWREMIRSTKTATEPEDFRATRLLRPHYTPKAIAALTMAARNERAAISLHRPNPKTTQPT